MHVIRKARLENLADLTEDVAAAIAAMPKASVRQPRPAGFPLLFSSDWQLVEPVVAYLHEHSIQRGRTDDTVRTYSEILFDWFETLEQNAICWRSADAVDLVAYRNRMLSEPSGHTGRPYQISTINLRVRGVLRFYAWAVRSGWLESSPLADSLDGSIASVPGPRVARDADSSIFLLRQYEALPRPLSPRQANQLAACLSSPYDLMAKWQIATGLRVSELLRLKTSDVATATGRAAEKQLIEVVRKGRKQGYVVAPVSLLEETRAYVRLHRILWIRRVQRRRGGEEPSDLFIGRRGRPVVKNTYQRAIRMAGESCGFKVVSHALRATFACALLARLEHAARDGAAVNPLLIVKILMGHERIETTDKYLRAIVVDDCVLMDALQGLVPDEGYV